jgi:hypothetical protein
VGTELRQQGPKPPAAGDRNTLSLAGESNGERAKRGTARDARRLHNRGTKMDSDLQNSPDKSKNRWRCFGETATGDTGCKMSPTQALRKRTSKRTGSDLSRTEKRAPTFTHKKHENETRLRFKTKTKSNERNNTQVEQKSVFH